VILSRLFFTAGLFLTADQCCCNCFSPVNHGIVKEAVFSLLLIFFLVIFTVILSPLEYEFNGGQVMQFGQRYSQYMLRSDGDD